MNTRHAPPLPGSTTTKRVLVCRIGGGGVSRRGYLRYLASDLQARAVLLFAILSTM